MGGRVLIAHNTFWRWSLPFLGSGPEGVDDLCFHTHGGFSPPSPSPPQIPVLLCLSLCPAPPLTSTTTYLSRARVPLTILRFCDYFLFPLHSFKVICNGLMVNLWYSINFSGYIHIRSRGIFFHAMFYNATTVRSIILVYLLLSYFVWLPMAEIIRIVCKCRKMQRGGIELFSPSEQ